MKKKVLCILVSLALVALCATCLIACGEDDKEENGQGLTQLKAPEVTRDGNNATWKKVENATKYELDISGEISYVDANTTSHPIPSGKILKVRAVGDGINYSTSNWSNGVYTSIELPDDEL